MAIGAETIQKAIHSCGPISAKTQLNESTLFIHKRSKRNSWYQNKSENKKHHQCRR